MHDTGIPETIKTDHIEDDNGLSIKYRAESLNPLNCPILTFVIEIKPHRHDSVKYSLYGVSISASRASRIC